MQYENTVMPATPTPLDVDGQCICLREDGMFVLRSWLAPESLQALRAEVESLEADPPYWARTPDKDDRNVVHFSPLTAHRLSGSGRISEIARVFNAPAFRHLCDRYIDRRWNFDRIIIERNFPRPNSIAPWHVDHFPYDGRCLKFFIYLNDTDAAGGALSYVPGSHMLVHELAAQLDTFDERQRGLHMYEQVAEAATAQAARCKAEGQHDRAARIEGLLARMASHIATADRSDDHYAIEAPAGSVIVFDPAGLHRGGVISRGERLIVRSHCLESKLARTFSSRNDFVVSAHRSVARATARMRGDRAFV